MRTGRGICGERVSGAHSDGSNSPSKPADPFPAISPCALASCFKPDHPDCAASAVSDSPKSRPYKNQMLFAQGRICGLLAILADRAGSIEMVSKMMATSKELAVSPPAAAASAVTRSNVAKTLAWAGDSYAALARNAGPAGRRASDWRLALSYYRQAQEAWAKLSDVELRPYRPDLKLIQQRIVECQNELVQ